MAVTRRSFLRTSAVVAGGFLALKHFAQSSGAFSAIDRYGALVPDPNGILELPPGFSYRLLSQTGERMDDGLLVPGYPDGMGAFPGPNGQTILVCNHELESKGLTGIAYRNLGPWGRGDGKNYPGLDRSRMYDAAGPGETPSQGGTTTIVYDPSTRKQVRRFLSLAGTERNCAGGVTPWGTWLSCEESTENADGDDYLEDHGYAFEVVPEAEPRLNRAVAYKAMGRFRREAVAVDPVTGFVYQTEDMKDGCFYRFVPDVPGKLGEGGVLEALAIVGEPERDTRNWSRRDSFALGEAKQVEWIRMTDVESPDDDLRDQAHDAGAAVFARSEGIWRAEDGVIYFAATTGGREELGQIFKFTPDASGGVLELFVEPNDRDILKNADNLTVAPWGDVIICEDYKGDAKLLGLTPRGQIYTFGRNVLNDSELAGACFSPDGTTLFVNIQKPGLTFAVTGPWGAV